MSLTIKCKTCKGSGKIYTLVSAHDDIKEIVICPECHGKGVIHVSDKGYHE